MILLLSAITLYGGYFISLQITFINVKVTRL